MERGLEICMWKNIFEDLESTTGQDMRVAAENSTKEHVKKARKCLDCDGSSAYAKKINCTKYIPSEKK